MYSVHRLMGGAVAVYCWRHALNPIRYLDFIAPNVLLAQAIGRLGNFVNQELYGPPTALPWAFHINPHYPCQLPPGAPAAPQMCGMANLTQETLHWYASHGFHPTFFYEAGWNLLMFGLLMFVIWRFGHRLRVGDGALLYLLAYPLGRLWVESFRPDAWTMGSLATAQWIALGSLAVATVVLVWRHQRWDPRQAPGETLAYVRNGFASS
jgi:phosphatidylglycerol---prolipoprotein diacylglyceryl transferase